MVNIINIKAGDELPWHPDSWAMIAEIVGKGVKALGQNTHGGHPADAERWDTGWLHSFDEAMRCARQWAEQQGIDTIYVQEKLTEAEHDLAMKDAISRILRKGKT